MFLIVFGIPTCGDPLRRGLAEAEKCLHAKVEIANDREDDHEQKKLRRVSPAPSYEVAAECLEIREVEESSIRVWGVSDRVGLGSVGHEAGDDTPSRMGFNPSLG